MTQASSGGAGLTPRLRCRREGDPARVQGDGSSSLRFAKERTHMAYSFSCAAPVTLALGGCKTGKTTWLADEATALLAAGTAPEDILVFCASPDGAAVFGRRLAERAGEAAARVRVTTPRQLALELLGTPEAVAFSGREPRMLSRYEESFLMEDMKTSGLRPKRIKELVNFFSRSQTELADLDPDWLIYKEEQETFALLESCLAAYRAYREPEIANTACRWLLENDAARAAAGRPYVLVDDLNRMGLASQQLALLLARTGVFATANPLATNPVYDSYPYAPGAAQLSRLAGTRVVELAESDLPQDTANAVNSLAQVAKTFVEEDALTDDLTVTGSAEHPGFGILAAADAREECLQVASWVQGAMRSGLEPGQIAVTVPNGTWERNVAAALAKLDIPCERPGRRSDVGGDIRYADLSRAARFCCLLRLAAQPDDAPSLRAWCGFGDYLTCRGGFGEVFSLAQARGLSLAQVLALLAEARAEDGSFPEEITMRNDAAKILARLDELTDALGALRGLTGPALLARAAELVGSTDGVPKQVAALVEGLPEDAGAAEAVRLMTCRMFFDTVSADNAVKLVSMERVGCLDVQAVACTGLVNGFYPKHATFDLTKIGPERAEKFIAEEAKMLMSVVSAGTAKTALFWFKTLRGADAEALDLKVERFSIRDGVRMAQLSRSVVLEKAGL